MQTRCAQQSSQAGESLEASERAEQAGKDRNTQRPMKGDPPLPRPRPPPASLTPGWGHLGHQNTNSSHPRVPLAHHGQWCTRKWIKEVDVQVEDMSLTMPSPFQESRVPDATHPALHLQEPQGGPCKPLKEAQPRPLPARDSQPMSSRCPRTAWPL